MVYIQITGLTKTFSGSVTLFRDFWLDIQPNEYICFFGPSGCGKTTLLNLLAGIIQPDVGTILFNNTLNHRVAQPKIGYVFQEPRLLPWSTVNENVTIVLEGSIKPKNTEGCVRHVLRLVRLLDYRNKYPGELSGGEKQRVSLARALSIKPEALLMDEPFSHLDELAATQLRVSFMKVLEKVKTTVIMTTHNPLEAIYLADRIVVLTDKKPTQVKKIINVRIPRPRTNDLYRKFIFEKSTKRIVHQIFG